MVSTRYITQKSNSLESEETLVTILSSGSQVELIIRITNKDLLENGWDLRMWIFTWLCLGTTHLIQPFISWMRDWITIISYVKNILGDYNFGVGRLFKKSRPKTQKLIKKRKTNLTTKKKNLNFCMARDPINRNRLEKLHLQQTTKRCYHSIKWGLMKMLWN